MDFAYHYTEEQERFRAEVSAWLDANSPPETALTAGGAAWVRLRLALGEKAWLAPSLPVEQGGAGLTADHTVIVLEELDRRGLLVVHDAAGAQLRSALLESGSESLRRELVPVLASGRAVVWRIVLDEHAEPGGDTLGVSARPDGDGFILDGEAAFTGAGATPTHLWTLAASDGDGAILALVVPAGLHGVSVSTPRTLAGDSVHRATFEDVWVPRTSMLGDEGDGWRVARTAALQDPALELPAPELSREAEALLRFARETTHEGRPLSEEPVRRMLLVEAYVDSRLSRLLTMRNQWRRSAGLPLTYELAQAEMLNERAALRLSHITQEVAGIYALLDADDPRAASPNFASQQRESVAGQNPTGLPDARRQAIAEALGMGKQTN